MIFVQDEICVFNGNVPEEVGVDILNILRSFIKFAPQEYVYEFISHLRKDLYDRYSFLYASDDKVANTKYWFDFLRCNLTDDAVVEDDDFMDNLNRYEWDVFYEEEDE